MALFTGGAAASVFAAFIVHMHFKVHMPHYYPINLDLALQF